MRKTEDRLEVFIEVLLASLAKRYEVYREPATPDTVLLAVLNAVHDAKEAVTGMTKRQDE